MMVPKSYKGSDDDEDVEKSPKNNGDNNNYNIVSDSGSDEEAKKNLFEDIDDENKATPKTALNPKWYMP